MRELQASSAAIVAEVRGRLGDRARRGPMLVAIDGPSGSGKSTLAALVAAETSAVIVASDDFYAADTTDADWDARSPTERAAEAIDWRRLRREALEPLLAGQAASWHPFDFEAGQRPDGTWPRARWSETRDPSTLIVLEGAYSARPELADLIELAIFVDVSFDLRHNRLASREDKDFLAAWHKRWDAAEDYYFREVRPPSSFDLVVHPA